MALADEAALGRNVASAIRGACLISGVYDLAPVLNISVNAEIGARAGDVEPLSPLNHGPAWPVPLIVTVGLGESAEWGRQSHLYAEVARAAGCTVSVIEVPDADHYSILLPMREAGHPVTLALTRLMGLETG